MVFNRDAKAPENIKIPKFVPKGVEAAKWILDRELSKGEDAKFLVYYDPDIDGLMAGLIAEQYLTKLGVGIGNKNYTYYLNSNRAHGFVLSDEQLSRLKGYTIIAVDFSISKKDFDRILRAGINLINIDHHEINIKEYTNIENSFICSKCNDSYGVILNNQYSFEPTNFRFLSGAGMVYYFFEYASKFYNVPVDVDVPAMVGITLLSDIREIEIPEAQSFLKYTYILNSEYMKYLQWLTKGEGYASQRFSPFGVPCLSRDYIDYTFSPIINALLRANRGDDALNLLRGNDETVQRLKSNDTLLLFREIQKRIISEIMKGIKEDEGKPGSLTQSFSKMKVCSLSDDFVVPNLESYNITNYIGVACSKIKDEDKTGVIFVIDRKTNKIIRGSVRGGREGVDYLSIFQKNGVPAAGHHNAFGILSCDATKIDFRKINEDIEKVESAMTTKNTRVVCEVRRLDLFIAGPMFKEICKYNSLVRDNFRIYLKFTGDTDDKTEVHKEIVSDKYSKYFINTVQVNCYDPTIDIKDAFILPSLDNNKYVRCTLRAGFEYDIDNNNEEIGRRLKSMRKEIQD